MNFYSELLQSGPIALLVLGLLLAFSVVSWAIIFVKYRYLKSAESTSKHFVDLFWDLKNFDQLYERSKRYKDSPAANLFQKSFVELRENKDLDGLDNLEHTLKKQIAHENSKLESLVPFLATVGSTSPFIGLFGTVIGIMNSFREIGASGSASLATVAPGIAEALIATAAGLVAAIPAVMAYNFFSVKIRKTNSELNSFATDIMRLSQRQRPS